MSNSNYSIGLHRLKPVHTAYCGLHNLAENWSWARVVNGRDRDKTEMLKIFLEMRCWYVSRPRPQPCHSIPEASALTDKSSTRRHVIWQLRTRKLTDRQLIASVGVWSHAYASALTVHIQHTQHVHIQSHQFHSQVNSTLGYGVKNYRMKW